MRYDVLLVRKLRLMLDLESRQQGLPGCGIQHLILFRFQARNYYVQKMRLLRAILFIASCLW